MAPGIDADETAEWDEDQDDDAPASVTLAAPPVAALIAKARTADGIKPRDRAAMLDAMRIAATRRVQGVLGKKRRRYYGHAAILVACCLELAPTARKQAAITRWLDELRADNRRFYAFRRELDAALAVVRSPSA